MVFESNKTYYLKDISSAAISLDNVEGLTIDGNGSTLLLGSLAEYIRVTNTTGCKIQNLHLDYETKPAFSAKCIKIDAENRYAVMGTDADIGLSNVGDTYTLGYEKFGVINTNKTRLHMRIEKYEKVDKNKELNILESLVNNQKNIFKLYFLNDANTIAQLESQDSLKGYGMICPMPNVGHLQERAATITANNGFEMENVYFHSASKFGMFIAHNDKEPINLTNVNFVPADNVDMDFTSWRDAFHCKDNRCAINWKDCTATGNYDDVFNISTTGLHLSSVDSTGKQISVVWNEEGPKPQIKAGDTISFINSATGEDYGTKTVKRVISENNLTLNLALVNALNPSAKTGESVYAYFTSLAAPNSTITNCDFSGTYRFRGSLTVSDTKIYNQRMWLDAYAIEGPVPKNITFKNCTITSGVGASIVIGANSPVANGYHVDNIVFQNCKLDSATLQINNNDKQYVKLIGCTENDGTPIQDIN